MSPRKTTKPMMTKATTHLALFGLALALGACKREAPATKTVPFEDDFERSELGPDWLASGGHWELEKGTVHTTGANNAPLFLKVALPPDVVVEVDVLSETPLVDGKLELMTDGRTHQSGYVFIAGGWSNQISVIARKDEHGTDRKERRPTGLVGKRWYRWRVEKKGGELRWLVDGQPYMTFSDPAPVHGPGNDRLAFGNWQNTLRFDRLRVWAHDQAPPPSLREGEPTPSAAKTSTTAPAR